MRWRLHPRPPRAGFIGAANRDILGHRPARAALAKEAGVVEAFTARHVVGVALRQSVKRPAASSENGSPCSGADTKRKAQAGKAHLHWRSVCF
jgi:hypothetical protein